MRIVTKVVMLYLYYSEYSESVVLQVGSHMRMDRELASLTEAINTHSSQNADVCGWVKARIREQL